MTSETLQEMIDEAAACENEDGDGTLYADGFEDAFVGFVYQFNRRLAVYDWNKCLSVLMERDGMSEWDAIEYMDFNVTCAWMGEYTPVFRYEAPRA